MKLREEQNQIQKFEILKSFRRDTYIYARSSYSFFELQFEQYIVFAMHTDTRILTYFIPIF